MGPISINELFSLGLDLLIFSAAGAAGYRIFRLLKIPSPTILGPLAAVAVVNILLRPLQVSFYLKPILSVVTGYMVGMRFSVKNRGALKYAVLMILWLLILSTVTALSLTRVGIDTATAIFSAFPGGLAEISLMSLDYSADSFTVTLLHAVRMLLTLAVMPLILRPITAALPVETDKNTALDEPKSDLIKDGWPTLIAACALALLLNFAGIPAGLLLGSMLGCGLSTKALKLNLKINRNFQRIVQIGIGGLVGLSIKGESLMNLGENIAAILVLNVLILGGSALFAIFLHRVSGWSWQTCILSSSPAGLSPTIMMSFEYGADSTTVTLFQVLRMVSALVTVPLAALLLL